MMRPLSRALLAAVLFGAAVTAAVSQSLPAQSSTTPTPGVDWPQFRGIDAAGIAEGFALPVAWKPPNVDTSTHVAWGQQREGAYMQLAENPLGETAMATPAISEGTMFLRTRTRLVAVGR